MLQVVRNLGKDGEHRPREEPRIPAAKTLATQPELARAAVVSHTSQSVLQGPKWAPGLCVQGGSRERTRRVLLFPLFGFFFLALTVFARTPPQCGPTLSAPPRGRRAREHSRAEGPKAADPSAFPHYQSHHGRPQQPALGGAVEPVLLFAATHPGHVLFPGFRKTWPHGPRTALVATAAFEFGRGICMYATP